jgi:hypothetical protein
MAKSKLGNDVRSQFTAANRIITILSGFNPVQRARIQDLVSEHSFVAEEPADTRTGDLFDAPSAEN